MVVMRASHAREPLADRIVASLLSSGKPRILFATGLLTLGTAVTDWSAGDLSLGGLYLLPMLLGAIVLSPGQIIVLAIACATLKCFFDDSTYLLQYAVRFVSSTISYAISGLFVVAVIRNREMALRHLRQLSREKMLRNEAQERLRTLVESSPAAIMTLDASGVVLAANQAANTLFGLAAGESLETRQIRSYLPMLADAVHVSAHREPFRTAAQAQGRKESGEVFLADLWFSTYGTPDATHLAVIVVDSTEELRNREEEHLEQLSSNSRLVVAAMLHEIRNLCGAISVVYSNLVSRESTCTPKEIQRLESLVGGLSRLASLELYGSTHSPAEEVFLQQVLDDLRIIIEPGWREVGGSVTWQIPDANLKVSADRYGLMQVFMNLAQNSFRAVQSSTPKRLSINVTNMANRIRIRFQDTGCGIANPNNLFQPFQRDADVTGLGLFISRAILRGYGGDLQFEPVTPGCCFVVDIPAAG